MRIPAGPALHEEHFRSHWADGRLWSGHPGRGSDRGRVRLLGARWEGEYALMERACPKCGCKLSAFDIEEPVGCPKCGLRFLSESMPIALSSKSQPSSLGWSELRHPTPPGVISLRIIVGLVLGFLAVFNPLFGIGLVIFGYWVAGSFTSDFGRRSLVGILLAIGIFVVALAIVRVGCDAVLGGRL